MPLKLFRVICIIISILVMIAIFCFSAEEASKSAQTSSKFISSVAKTFSKDFNSLSDDEQETIISKYQFLARKFAHFSLFALLGFFVFLSVITYDKIKFKVKLIFSILISAVYAASDEVHQLFVKGRSCELRDFFVDIVGSFLGIIIALAAFVLFSKIKGRKEKYVKEKFD